MPKPYVPNTWTDNVTPVDKAHMDNIENELVWLDARVPTGGFVSYGTTLPGSPVDGQEAILVDSTTNPTYQWRFRYNAGSTSPYKWEFVGGASMQAVSGPANGYANTTYVALGTPSLTLPRAGDYEWTLQIQMSPVSGQPLIFAIPAISVGAASDTGAIQISVATGGVMGSQSGRVLGVPASSLLSTYVRVNTASANFDRGSLCVRPVRVS